MSPRQSAQSPTADPQPTKEDSYLDPHNPVSKNPLEEACSDTPLTSDPYDSGGNGGSGSGTGGDYFTCRKVPAPTSQSTRHWGPGSNSPRPASPAFFIPHSVLEGKKSGVGSGHISPSQSHSPAPVPAPAPGLPERGARGGPGPGVQYSSGQLQRKGSSHPLRQALGVDQVHEEENSGVGEKESERGQDQDQVKMAPPSEGKVARSVEGTREKAREEQVHAQEYNETGRRESGQRRKSSAGQRHGRIRGEVSLNRDEAELERQKAQQS